MQNEDDLRGLAKVMEKTGRTECFGIRTHDQ